MAKKKGAKKTSSSHGSGKAAKATRIKPSAKKKPGPAGKQVRDGAVQERDFFRDVMDVVRQIPRGRVTSYGAIAKYLGAGRSSRIVGYCMNNSSAAKPAVPAHRVVNRIGMLSGKHHFGEPDRMEKLLAKEGVKVKKDLVVDFKKLFWDPMMELDL
jgi:methylated-DNA-protein-cysteine methyltransferase related protein